MIPLCFYEPIQPDFQDHYMTYGKPIWVTEFACVDGKEVVYSVV